MRTKIDVTALLRRSRIRLMRVPGRLVAAVKLGNRRQGTERVWWPIGTMRKPRTRYTVGRDATFVTLMACILPDRLLIVSFPPSCVRTPEGERMKFQGVRLLLLGANGFVGRAVLDLVLADAHVSSLVAPGRRLHRLSQSGRGSRL